MSWRSCGLKKNISERARAKKQMVKMVKAFSFRYAIMTISELADASDKRLRFSFQVQRKKKKKKCMPVKSRMLTLQKPGNTFVKLHFKQGVSGLVAQQTF